MPREKHAASIAGPFPPSFARLTILFSRICRRTPAAATPNNSRALFAGNIAYVPSAAYLQSFPDRYRLGPSRLSYQRTTGGLALSRDSNSRRARTSVYAF